MIFLYFPDKACSQTDRITYNATKAYTRFQKRLYSKVSLHLQFDEAHTIYMKKEIFIFDFRFYDKYLCKFIISYDFGWVRIKIDISDFFLFHCV